MENGQGQGNIPSAEKVQQYRRDLLECRHQAIDEWDKWLLGLSSGALGVSIAFIKEIVTPEKMVAKGILLTAWVMWLVCLILVLLTFYFSFLANQKSLQQLKNGSIWDPTTTVGGWWTLFVNWTNPLAGLFFVLGIGFIIAFAYRNLGMPGQDSFAAQTASQKTNVTNMPQPQRPERPPPPPPPRPERPPPERRDLPERREEAPGREQEPQRPGRPPPPPPDRD